MKLKELTEVLNYMTDADIIVENNFFSEQLYNEEFSAKISPYYDNEVKKEEESTMIKLLLFVDGPMNDYNTLEQRFKANGYLTEYMKQHYKDKEIFIKDCDVNIISANRGISHSLEMYEYSYNSDRNFLIITNEITLLNYVPYDENKKHFPIEVYHNQFKKFMPLAEMSPKELRPVHNLTKMYLNGIFGNVYIPEKGTK